MDSSTLKEIIKNNILDDLSGFSTLKRYQQQQQQ